MKFVKNHILYLAWAVSLFSMLDSLYFSDIRGFTPCVLCWYQRICMYPLILVLGVGILKKDRSVFWYAWPLSFIGLLIAGYHNLLYYGAIPEQLAPCVAGVSCTTKFVEYFGFVSIPLLSLAAFLIINLSLYIYLKTRPSEA